MFLPLVETCALRDKGKCNGNGEAMASYHCSVRVGSKGKGGPHAEYISREGKYVNLRDGEKLEAKESGNMPAWSAHSPTMFWQVADEHERANGAVYREIEIALPRELTSEQRVELVRDFVRQEIGEKHAYTWAIHTPKAKLEGGEQPHAHIMYSERSPDGIDRDPAQYFKRYNAKSPEKGGCRKDSAGTEELLQATRQRWETVQNRHLEMHRHDVRVDHRSLKAQGLTHEPERHMGPVRAKRLSADDRVSLTLHRSTARLAAEAQREVRRTIPDIAAELRQQLAHLKERADKIVSTVKTGIDGFLAKFEAHKAEQERQQRMQQERAKQEQARKAELERAQKALEMLKQQKPKPQPKREQTRDDGPSYDR